MMNTKRILVVDNEPHMQRLLEFTLRKSGATVQSAGSGGQALVLLRENPIDLMIIDYLMPGLDGFQVIRAIRDDSRLKDLPIIMMTSRGQTDVREAASGLGIAAFHTKPFSPTDLLADIKRILHL
jgi:CheY-like chemotaxis protein